MKTRDAVLEMPQVYIVADPRGATSLTRIALSQVFYVGSTHKGFFQRADKHRQSVTSKGGTNSRPMKQRLAEIKASGHEPIFLAVEYLSFDATKEQRLIRERYWTEFYRAKGAPLLNKQRAIRREDERPKPPVLRSCKCERCKKPFVTLFKNKRFCSRKCKHLTLKRRLRGLRPLPEILKRSCLYCGKAFSTARPSKMYCRKQCKKNAQKKRRRLEKRARVL